MEETGDVLNAGGGDEGGLNAGGGLNANAGGGGGVVTNDVDNLQTEVVTNDVDNLQKVAEFINDNLSDGNVEAWKQTHQDAHPELSTYVELIKGALNTTQDPPLDNIAVVTTKLREIVKALQGITGDQTVTVIQGDQKDGLNRQQVNEAIVNAGLSNFQPPPPPGPTGGEPNSGGGENLERLEPTKEITVVKAAYEADGNKTGIRFGLPINSEDYPYIGPDSIKGAGWKAGLRVNDLVIEINGTHMQGRGAPDDDRGTTKDYITQLMGEKVPLVFKVIRKG